MNNNSPFTISLAEDHTNPTLHPETSHPPPASGPTEMVLEMVLKPIANKGAMAAVINEPDPTEKTGEDIAPDPVPLKKSDQVHEMEPTGVAERVLVEIDGLEVSPAH